MDWYKEHIEEPVRSLVKLLRNNGFNTECSCGHEMYVQCQYILDGDIMRLHNLLFNNGYRDYEINVIIQVKEGYCYPSLDLKLKNKNDNMV